MKNFSQKTKKNWIRPHKQEKTNLAVTQHGAKY